MCLRCDGSAIGNVLNAFLPREMDVILRILPYNASCVQVCMQWGREVREGGMERGGGGWREGKENEGGRGGGRGGEGRRGGGGGRRREGRRDIVNIWNHI